MTSFGCIAFYVAPLELAVVPAETEVEGETTLFDECMSLIINKPGPLVRESFLRWWKMKSKLSAHLTT